MNEMVPNYYSDGTGPKRIFLALRQLQSAFIANSVCEGPATFELPYFLSGSPQENMNDMLAP